MSNHVSIHIDAKSTVEFHCEHDDGVVSLRIAHPSDGGVCTYLAGTLDELDAIADRITDATARLRGETGEAAA